MNLQKRSPPAALRALVQLLLAVAALPAFGSDNVQVYTVEAFNDTEFAEYPPLPPSREVVREFTVRRTTHEEVIDVASTHLRNLSITLENEGPDLIRAPYLYGPRGWDFRSLEKLAAAISSGRGVTAQEKFIRAHEWKGRHVYYVVGHSYDPYDGDSFASNPLRVLNQYGAAMCGQSTCTLNGILRVIPPLGSMYGRIARLDGHRVGEAFWEGRWHAYDTTPGAGIIQWIYYDDDNETIAPSWKYLIAHPDLVTRIKPWSGFSLGNFLDGASGDTTDENVEYPGWDFNYDLRPDESLTMYFDMRGRLDKTSARQDNSGIYRCYSDYGSAVFRYRPDFTNDIYREYAVDEENTKQTSGGLLPRDPSRSSWIVFEMRSTWCFAGADIAAWFKTGGKVYIAVKADPFDTEYSSSLSWQRLDPTQAEYASSIEGKMAYWVKFQFEGEGSGLEAAEIASEVQMSPWSMPGLEYGRNRIRFEAAEMGRSPLTVRYVFDDASPIHNYEPATTNYGRHIGLRIGGVLQQGSRLDRDDYRKGEFWERIHEEPDDLVLVKLEIYKVSGEDTGRLVRTLVNRRLRYAYYDFYWDGRDDAGNRLPEGMYAYKLTINGKLVHGERLYLFGEIWPRPNEIEEGSLPGIIPMANADPTVAKVGEEVKFWVTPEDAIEATWRCLWDFGDESTRQGASVTHSYEEKGAYQARVTVRAGDSVLESTVTVQVVEEPSGGDDSPGGGDGADDDDGKGDDQDDGDQDDDGADDDGADDDGADDDGADDDGKDDDGKDDDGKDDDGKDDDGKDDGSSTEPPVDTGDSSPGDLPPDEGGSSSTDSDATGPEDEPSSPRTIPLKLRGISGQLRLQAAQRWPGLCRISGTLPQLPEGWLPEGKIVRVGAGGVATQFVLDAKGRARSEGGNLRFHFKRKGGKLVRTNVGFVLYLLGDLKTAWLGDAAGGGRGKSRLSLSLPFELSLGDLVYGTEMGLDVKLGARKAKLLLR